MMLPINKAIIVRKFLIYKTLPIILLWSTLGLVGLSAQVLTCPDDYVVNLPEDKCSVAIYYDSLDWSADFPAHDPVFFPFPGTFLPTGITLITLAVSDNNNNFYTCDFEVNILAYGSTNFTCPGVVNVTLEGECERMLTATDILGNGFNPCDEDYTTEIFDGSEWVPAIINADDVGSSFNVLLTNFETGHSCETVVTVIGGETPSITCPSNKVQLCNVPTTPAFTGIPMLTGCFDTLALSFSDNLTFTQCPDTFAFQITRTWTAVSPNGTQTTCEQLITGKRFPMGLVVFPPDRNGIAAPALNCNDTLNLTATAHPNITGWPLVGNHKPDNSIHCKYAVSYVDNITHLCGDSYEIKRAWSVVRLCGSQTVRDTQTILVLDESPPFFEIPDTLYFSNSGACVDSVFLPAADIISECSAFDELIQTPWGDFTSNGAWIHPDTVPGIYLIDYKFEDACSNDTTKTLVLKITDETLVSCPPSDTVTCDYYLNVISLAIQTGNYDPLEAHGMPNFYDNCSYNIAQNAVADVDGCGNGVVTRFMVATNAADTLNCEQSIVVEHVSNFVAQFPPDASICVAPAAANLPPPTLSMVNCEALAPSFTDMVIPSGLPGCYTVLRHWTIINTCAYAGSSTGDDEEIAPRTFRDNGDGYMTYTQTIHVNNNAAITFPDGCEISDLYLGASSCTYDFIVPSPNVDGCGDNIVLTITGSLGTTIGASVGITPGNYSVTYKATDACGKMKTCVTAFEVFDTVAPVAICKQQFSVDLPQGCIVEIFASDFDDGSSDNCDNSLNFSLAENIQVDYLEFDACDLGLNFVDLWVTDAEGNKSHCQAEINIESTLSACGCDPSIGGRIKTANGSNIANVQVSLTSTNGYNQTVTTGTNGEYLFVGVPIGWDYEIKPEKNSNPLNGVTTFDLVLIRRHILGTELLNSPSKMIAADINNSSAVTTFDIVEIQKLILLINTNFPSNKSWRFIDADYVFPNPANPFTEPLPATIMVNDFSQDLLDLDFTGIKIGDVNNSASPMMFLPNENAGDK